MMTNPTSGPSTNGVRESPLMRKLQAVKESPLGKRSVTRGLDGIVEEKENVGGTRRRPIGLEDDPEEEEMRLRKKELEAQKARIVAQMAPVKEDAEGEIDDNELENEDEDTPPPMPAPQLKSTIRVVDRENVAPSAGKYGSLRGNRDPFPLQRSATAAAPTAPVPPPKLNGFDAAAQTLCAAFDAHGAGRVYRDPHFGSTLDELPDEKVFIVSWVDYCNKYGMGYALTDGSVGVHFNDSTTLVLSPDKV